MVPQPQLNGTEVKPSRPGRKFSVWLLISFLLAFGAAFYPLYVIRPFRYQGPRELAAALTVIRVSPYVEFVAVMLCLGAFIWYWRRQQRRRPRVLAGIGAALVCVIAVLSRVNIYEIMFHPDNHPSFSQVAQSKLDGDEKVMAINVGGVARAYPIRSMSYHHIVNDMVGGVPIVATY